MAVFDDGADGDIKSGGAGKVIGERGEREEGQTREGLRESGEARERESRHLTPVGYITKTPEKFMSQNRGYVQSFYYGVHSLYTEFIGGYPGRKIIILLYPGCCENTNILAEDCEIVTLNQHMN